MKWRAGIRTSGEADTDAHTQNEKVLLKNSFTAIIISVNGNYQLIDEIQHDVVVKA